jgi:alkylation response protein AidB-like acyl-CoA dehydrogenase
MDLTMTDEQLLLKQSAERYLAERYSFADRERYCASAKGWDSKVWADFAQFGWLALPFAEEHGGLGGGAVELAILGQAFGGALVLEPYLPSIVSAGFLLEQLGSRTQVQKLLPALINGTSIFAFAHDEPASRLAPAPISTRAEQQDGSWVLSGSKTMVRAADSADYFLVSANVESAVSSPASSTALFVVKADTAGLEFRRYGLIDGTAAGDLKLNRVTVGDQQRLGEDCALTERVIRAANDRALIFAAAQATGSMRAVLDATISYTKTRQQFGQPLAANQVIKHRLVDMAIACEEASAIAFRAALLGDSASAAAAKIKVSRAARLVAEQSIQLHGGMGVTEELNIGAYFKQLLTFEMSFGATRQVALEQFARLRSRAVREAA